MHYRLFLMTPKAEKFFKDARKEYEKRLSRYCKLTIKEYKNTEKLFKDISKEKFIVFIREEGLMLSSEELAIQISKLEVKGVSDIAVVVGVEEFNDTINSDKSIFFSISQMSLSANMVEVVILEQIYRAYKIINGETYHK